MRRDRFERHVADALASIPRRFRDALRNIAIVVEEEPDPALLDEMGIEPPDTLLGLYQGTPLTERHWGHGNALPDRVIIFQGPHERLASSPEHLAKLVEETVWHEIAHYFGMNELQVRAAERRRR